MNQQESETLKWTTVQADLKWEDVDGNLAMFDELLEGVKGATDVIILPEMFSTGFSMRSKALAETHGGKTLKWMHEKATYCDAVVTGSLIFKEEGRYLNRLIWMRPDGSFEHYDKHQLFKMSGEHEHFSAGQEKVIITHKGWRICPMICYDLRFPVWARNVEDYDLLMYVANWPVARSAHWRALLKARAIENQAYVIGVNRVGHGNGLDYSGNTSVIEPYGAEWYHVENEVKVDTHTLSKAHLMEVRAKIPYLQDRDVFEVKH